jgi:rod shape-determining protein MreB
MIQFGNTLRATISPDLGLDLGTANTVIYERGVGVVLNEPSVAAYDAASGRLIAVGREAKAMEGRAPSGIRVVHPLRRGTISDFHAAQALAGTLLDRVLTTRPRLAPRLITSIPGCATDIECKAVEQAVRAAGARFTTYVPQAVAAAVGAGIDITTCKAVMIVDIGGGTTEIAVLGSSGVILLRSIQIGGDAFDDAIRQRLTLDRFLIGQLTAEQLKIRLGYVGRPRGSPPMRVAGADLHAGAPRMREVSESMVGEAIKENVEGILHAVWTVLESSPPDAAADLIDSGIVLTGGGALIAGLAQEISMRTGIPTTAAPNPLECVARGAGEILGSPTLLESLRPQADKLTRWYQSLRIGMRESFSP